MAAADMQTQDIQQQHAMLCVMSPLQVSLASAGLAQARTFATCGKHSADA
jgi:hypothetical protein